MAKIEKKRLRDRFKEWTNPITKKHTYSADRYDIIYWGRDDPTPYVLFYRGLYVNAYKELYDAKLAASAHLDGVLKYDL